MTLFHFFSYHFTILLGIYSICAALFWCKILKILHRIPNAMCFHHFSFSAVRFRLHIASAKIVFYSAYKTYSILVYLKSIVFHIFRSRLSLSLSLSHLSLCALNEWILLLLCHIYLSNESHNI